MKNVGQLIEALKEFDPEMTVIISKDAEGNAFSPWYDISLEQFDLREGEPVEDDEFTPNAIVLWRA